jgi:hypothetical protein
MVRLPRLHCAVAGVLGETSTRPRAAPTARREGGFADELPAYCQQDYGPASVGIDAAPGPPVPAREVLRYDAATPQRPEEGLLSGPAIVAVIFRAIEATDGGE